MSSIARRPLRPLWWRWFAQGHLDQSRAFFVQQIGDPAGARLGSLQALEDLRLQQAASMAYFDVFMLCAVVSVVLVVLVLLMKRSVAEKGESIVAE